MTTSSDRILTTHTGSLPRPVSLTDRHDQQAVKAAVADAVGRQLAAGVDVINDGEATNYIEHPELVAQRICRYAGLVGRQNVMAGTDCGFATFATFASFINVEPEITWAKLAAMAEGARLASARLWTDAR